MTRVDESIFGVGEDLGDGFFEIWGRGVGEVGTADTVCKNGVTDKNNWGIMSDVYRFRVFARNDKETNRARGVAGSGNDFDGFVSETDFFGERGGWG